MGVPKNLILHNLKTCYFPSFQVLSRFTRIKCSDLWNRNEFEIQMFSKIRRPFRTYRNEYKSPMFRKIRRPVRTNRAKTMSRKYSMMNKK